MLIFDLESDGLLDELTKIHCLCIYDTETDTYDMYDKHSWPIIEGIKRLAAADKIMGHNIVAFDIPAIKKIFPFFKPTGLVVDTLVWARLVYQDIRQSDFALQQQGKLPAKLIGRHSLKAYGYRLGILKGDFGDTTDWKEWSPEMSVYCQRDVQVTGALVLKLQTTNTTAESLRLEHDIAEIIARQEQRGCGFNRPAAEALYVELQEKRRKLLAEIRKEFPPFYLPGKEFTPKRDNKKMGYVAGATFTRISLVEFNPSSNRHVYTHLIKVYGWKPDDFVKKGKAPQWLQEITGQATEPTINDEIISALPYPTAKPIGEYLMLNKRIQQIAEGKQAWLQTFNAKTQRIHGAVNPCGALGGRMTHFYPNLAQVPNNHAPYGKECRSLFGVFDENFQPIPEALIGCDANSLEAFCLAHYLFPYDDGQYARTISEGKKEDGTDNHTINSKILGVDRDTAKRFLYAFIYGAGPGKLGSIVGGDAALGVKLRKKFMKGFPGLKKLMDAVQKAVKERGHIKGLDGRIVRIRSAHSALNTILQGAGALIMKKAAVIADQQYQEDGLVPGVDYEFILNVHDEVQIERISTAKPAAYYGETMAEAIGRSCDYFKFRCRVGGSFDIGSTWAETH
jgi:DNA polymerase-1